MSIPGILFGRSVVVTPKASIIKVQRIENKVWRYLLGIGGYSTVESLRGEIGASMMQTRIMETMLLFVIDTLASNFEDIKRYMNDTIERGKGQWINTVNDYRAKIGLSWEELREIDRKSLKMRIKEYDTQLWLEGMNQKPVLRWYMLGKQSIEYENCYRNNGHSVFLAKARTNSLQLEEHQGRGKTNYSTICRLCGEEEEDLVHFLIKCRKLEEKRDPRIIDRTQMNAEYKTIQLFFMNKDHQEVVKMIKNMWYLRKRMRDDLRPP